MVAKRGKYGVRSGNTLKASSTRYHKQYQLQSLLIRKVQSDGGDSGVDNYVKTDYVKSNQVPYSLNKKGRWSLPEILKESILDGENTTEGFGIQLVERHKVNKFADCVSICSSTNLDAGSHKSSKIRQKRHGYLHVKSILNNRRGLTRRQIRDRRRRGLPWPVEDNMNPENRETNMIKYEVVYPAAANSSISHNPRYIGYQKPCIWRGFYNDRAKQRNIRRTEHMIKDSIACMDMHPYDFEEDEDEFSSPDGEDYGCNGLDTVRSHGTVLFEEALKQAQSAKTLSNNRIKMRKSNGSRDDHGTSFEKGHIIYEDTKQSNVDTATSVQAVSIPNSPRTEHVSVMLPVQQVVPQNLSQCYGNKYRECDCLPRKFVIDISEEVSNIDSFKSFYGDDVGRVNACVIFALDVDNEINNVKENVYNISLNTNFNASKRTVKIETMFDYMETNVADVILRTVFFIETLPLDALAFEKIPHSYHYKGNQLPSCLEETANWKSHSYRPNNSFFFNSFIGDRVPNARSDGFDGVPHMTGPNNDIEIVDTSQMDAYCGICYESLATTPGTALISCQHWFCDDCWTEHLGTRVRSGAVSLPCPEYDCDNRVDPGTVLTLLNMHDIIKFTKLCHDNNVEQTTVTKWCPNVKCGRVIEVNSNETKTARCECGKEVCFECLGSPHWPAACKTAANYHRKLRDTGDAGMLPDEFAIPIVVNGKTCPSCGRFVEKRGGCPYMFCICQKAFCWGCGKDYSSNNHDSSCQKGGYKGDDYRTQQIELHNNRKLGRRQRTWYKVALSHRLDAHPLKIQVMKSKLTGISKRLQNYVARKSYLGDPVELNFELANRKSVREVDKVPLFLSNSILLYTEIHQLVENTAVILDSDSLDRASRDGLTNAIARLSNLSPVIYELFMNGSTIPAGDLLTKLQEVRARSRQAIQGLIRCVSASGV